MAEDDVERSLEDRLLNMKNTSELMVDLAYSSLLYNNREIAEEVFELEDTIDDRDAQVQRLAFEAYEDGEVTLDQGLAMIRLSMAAEVIADGAAAICDVVLREVELHPVFRLSMRESDVIITRVVVQEGSTLDGSTLGEEHVATETGMRVIAVRRGGDWRYGPGQFTRLLAGDALVARGPEDGEAQLRSLAGVTEEE